uniref:Secreted protein n=1 Tax=Haemonchus placei TaxID=6290 RepID=A0A0N4WNI5_HAEPC
LGLFCLLSKQRRQGIVDFWHHKMTFFHHAHGTHTVQFDKRASSLWRCSIAVCPVRIISSSYAATPSSLLS